jgi:hypothetical protein
MIHHDKIYFHTFLSKWPAPLGSHNRRQEQIIIFLVQFYGTVFLSPCTFITKQ